MAGTLHLPGSVPLPSAPALLNDVQLVALVAAVLAPTGGGGAVDEAFELVAEVLVKAGQGRLKESIEAYRASATTT